MPTSLRPLICYETSNILGSDGQFEGVAVGKVSLRPGGSEEDIRAALRTISEQCRPCGGDFAAKQLALLRARTKMRADQDGKLLAVAYIDWLAEYPPDVAKAACEEWARTMPFFPAWSELQTILDRLASKRLALRKALADALKPREAVLYLGKPAPETRAMRLKTIRDAYSRNNNPYAAARAERMLAAEEGREPEEWARNLPDEEPQAAPNREPFKPKDDEKTNRLRTMAAEFRARKEAEDAARRQTEAA